MSADGFLVLRQLWLVLEDQAMPSDMVVLTVKDNSEAIAPRHTLIPETAHISTDLLDIMISYLKDASSTLMG